MHLFRQTHAHIYLPEGGTGGDETAQMRLTKYKQREKEFLGSAGTEGICNCSSASVRKCAGLIFQLLDGFGDFRAVDAEKMNEKVFLESWKMRSENSEGAN